MNYLHTPEIKVVDVREELEIDDIEPISSDVKEKNTTMKINIQESFLDILNKLDEYINSVNGTEKPYSRDISRVELENIIRNKLSIVGIYTEVFWENISWNKDIFSYKFQQRFFPTYGEEENKVVVVNKETKKNNIPDIFKACSRREKIQQIQSKYDIRETISRTLNAEYTDEGNTSSQISYYKTLEQHRYYDMVSQDIITRIFQLLLKIKSYGIMLQIFCLLISTREYCHMVFHESVLEIMFNDDNYIISLPDQKIEVRNPFRDPDYIEIIYHFLFYGIYLLYKEECIVKAYASSKHRFILPLNAAQWLPIYDGSIDTNPYLPISLSNVYLHGDKIPNSEYLIKPLRVSGTNRGLYNPIEFSIRFNIFTDELFNGMPMDKIWFGGSVIAACVTKNPLELLFGIRHFPNGNISERIPGDADYPEYLEKVGEIKDHWKNQSIALDNYFDEYYPSKGVIKDSLLKSEEILDIEEKLSDIDVMIDILDDDDFDKYTNLIVDSIKKRLSEKMSVSLSDISDKHVRLIKINTKKSYKYYVSGLWMKRSLEIFRLYGAHPIGGVSRFHFPAVRGIYDGKNVLLFPSLISYSFTGIFVDYKWMSSCHNAKDLILKYYTRGGVPILNETEHKYIVSHIKEHMDMWGTLLKYPEEQSRNISIMNPAFRPRLHGHGIYNKLKGFLKVEFISNEWQNDDPEFIKKWNNDEKKSRFGFDISLRFPSGHLRPLLLWKIMPYTTTLDKSQKYTQ
jgi:hypothetical protein